MENSNNHNDIQCTTDEVEILVARQDVFYEDELQDSRDMRNYSEIIFTKKVNNWIKTVLINKYCDKLKIR